MGQRSTVYSAHIPSWKMGPRAGVRLAPETVNSATPGGPDTPSSASSAPLHSRAVAELFL